MEMMVKNLKKMILALSFGAIFFIGEAHAACASHLKIDGYNQIITVWQEIDTIAQSLKIMGSYGNSNPKSVVLTDPFTIDASNPVLASSQSKSKKNVTAAVVWKALDLKTKKQMLQVAVATNDGWSTDSTITISDPDNEIPQNQYQIEVSENGLVIGVVWSSLIISEGKIVTRRVYSDDRGESWSKPTTLCEF